MTENETNQRTITEQMNRKESETVGEARPGEERSEVKVKGTCTVAMMAGMATEGSGCVPRRHDDLTPHTRHTAWTHSATVWTDHVLRRFRLMYLHTIPDTCAQASPCAHHVGIMCTYEHEHTAQCSHAACTIQRALRRAVAREWGMPSLIDSKDALGAPWLGLEHAYHNGQCRQNDQWWHTDYMLVGGYSIVLSIADCTRMVARESHGGQGTSILSYWLQRRLHSVLWWLESCLSRLALAFA